jgi:peroxisomal 3,2-trans-enoyl-CoA isomerase
MLKNFSRLIFNASPFQNGHRSLATTARTFSSATDDDLLISRDGNGIRTLTLNRPDKLNALNLNLYQAIPRALSDTSDPSSITVVTGNGSFFSSGNDLMNFAPMVFNPTPEAIRDLAAASRTLLENYVAAFIDFPGILVGVVNGPAVGISATTLALFDVVYAVNTAYFRAKCYKTFYGRNLPVVVGLEPTLERSA